MAIHIDVLARIHERQVRREVEQMGRQLDADGAALGERFGGNMMKGISGRVARDSPLVQRAFNALTDATLSASRASDEYGTVVQRSGIRSQAAVRASEDLERARRREADAHRAAGAALRKHIADLQNAEDSLKSTSDIVQQIGTAAFRTSRGIATIAGPALLKGLVDTIGIMTTATQSLYLLPAAATAAAAGIGTLQLATAGFGDTLKQIRDPEKFAEGLALLGPNAQQAALEIRNILPELDKLKYATQDAFFNGLAEQIHNLSNEFLPEIQTLTTNVAGSYNNMIKGVISAASSPGGQSSIQTLVENISLTFKNLEPAAQSIAQAFLDISAAGSSFLPGLAKDISNAATQFANFISQASQSGKLSEWIAEGIEAVKELGSAISAITQIFYRVFNSDGKSNIETFKNDIQTVREVVGFLTLDTKTMGETWRNELDSMHGPLGELRDAIMDIPEVFATLVNKVIDGLNYMGHNTQGFFDSIPGFKPLRQALGGKDYQDIPHMDVGDWAGYTPTPPSGTQQGRYGNVGYTGTDQTLNGPKTWDNPTTGQKMVLVPGIGWLPSDDPRAKSNQTAGLGPYAPSAVPAPPPKDANGNKLSDSDILNQIRGNLDPSTYKVDPFAPVPGLPAVTGIGPLGPDIYSAPGYQANPQDVIDKETTLEGKAHDLEEARKDRLALEQSNTASAEQINDAKWKEHEKEQALQKAQADLAEKLRGTAKDMKNGMDQLGAALDPDLGLSKGLAGLAENFTKMLGNILLGPTLQNLQATANASPIQGGFGLMGILGADNISKGLSPILGRPYPDGMNPYSASGANSPYGNYSSYPGWHGPTGAAGQAMPGESARDFAHRVMMPFWQSQGLQVGDHEADKYGEHQNGALDIMVPDIATGNQVLQQVLSDPNVYGAIFNNQTYGYGHGATPQDYSGGHTGDPSQDHLNHVHAFYKPGDPNNINPNGTGVVSSGANAAFGSTAGIGSGTPVFVTNWPGGGTIGGLLGAPAGSPASGPGAGPPPGPAGSSLWDAVASAEASGNWAHPDNGTGHYGGLQFSPSTWKAFGGVDLTGQTNPAMATREQQIEIANRTAFTGYNGTKPQGLSAWEAITKGMVPGVDTSTPASAFMGGGGAGESPFLPGVPLRPNSGGGGTLNFGQPALPNVSGYVTLPGAATSEPNSTSGLPGGGLGPSQINTDAGITSSSPFGAPDMGMSNTPGGNIGPFGTPQSVAAYGPGMAGASVGAPLGSLNAGVGAPSAPAATQTQPGVGPTQIGATVGPPTGTGAGGVGITPGGTVDTALNLAAGAFPGVGQAAATGVKLGSRAIQYAGQLAGIGVEGLMQTFLPSGGSELANNGWFTRILGGIAGALPAIPNVAGQQGGKTAPPPLTPEQAFAQNGMGPGMQQGVTNNISVDASHRDTGDGIARDIAAHQTAQYQAPGRP